MSILSSYIFGRNPNGFVLKLLGNLKHNINNMKQYVHELTHSLNFKKKFICKNCLLVQMHLVVYTAYKCIDYYTKWITFVCTNWFSLPLTFIERLGIKCKHVFFSLILICLEVLLWNKFVVLIMRPLRCRAYKACSGAKSHLSESQIHQAYQYSLCRAVQIYKTTTRDLSNKSIQTCFDFI